MKKPKLLPVIFLVLALTACTNAGVETVTVPTADGTVPTGTLPPSALMNITATVLQPAPSMMALPSTESPMRTAVSGEPTLEIIPKGKAKKTTRTPSSANIDFIANEITGNPTDSSVTINVVPADNMKVSYEYGTAPGTYTFKTTPQDATAREPLETVIKGLQPNTNYYYRINYNGNTGPEHTFVTQRAPGTTFTFGIQGDSHPERTKTQFNPDLYTRTLLSAAADMPDFYFTIGDDFSVDTLKEVNPETVRALYIKQRQWLGLVGAPVFLVNGNHEQASLANLDGTPDNVAVWAQTARNAFYPQPAPDGFYTGDVEQVEHIGLLRDYYAFTWGDALFMVIDPYWHSPQAVDNLYGADRSQKKGRDLWNVTLGETQYRWFQQTLENNPARYKFVFAHHINGTGRGGIELAHSYEWGDSAGYALYRPGWEKTIHQLMADNDVTIFFQGHDHIFARQELDGVIYQTLPEPANPFYSWENEDAFKTGDKFPNSGRIRVTVSPRGVTVTYIRTYLDRPDEETFSYTVK